MNTLLDPAAKKAYEVGYALFRVAAVLPSRSFAELLEREALELLHSTINNLPDKAGANLQSLNFLISFGKDTGNIHVENADLLIREIGSLEALMVAMGSPAKEQVAAADLDDIFSKALPRPSMTETKERTAPSISEAISLAGLKDRQEVILEKIRQSGNCRTRDLQAILPDLSERTLRYDLQRLVEQGRIERGGGGGPASWYRVREGVTFP